LREMAEKEREASEETAVLTSSSETGNKADDDGDFHPVGSDSETELTDGKKRKRRKIVYDQVTVENEPLQHLRESIRKVRPAVYEAIDRMKSQLHTSDSQAAGACLYITANFGAISDDFAVRSRISPERNKISKIGKRRCKLRSLPHLLT